MKKFKILLIGVLLCAGTQNVNAQSYTITTVVGTGEPGYNGDNFPAVSAQLYNPTGLAIDEQGNLYIAEWNNNRVRKVNGDGVISTVVGNGNVAFNGDNIYGPSAQISAPIGISFDDEWNLFIADGNKRVRKLNTSGIISTIAGDGSDGCEGDNSSATIAEFKRIFDVEVDHAGNVYIVDGLCNCVRKIDNAGVIKTIAGTGISGYSGDGGPATSAQLDFPLGILLDDSGNLYISDSGNDVIRKVDSQGIITTFAGTNVGGYSGDNGPAAEAEINKPYGLTMDKLGNIYFSGNGNEVIRKIDNAGIITTIAGDGTAGYSGDNGPATEAKLHSPAFLVFDEAGNIYVSDESNHRVRKLIPDNLSMDDYQKSPVKIYPNPVHDNLTIENEVSLKSVTVYDAVGRLIQQVEPSSVQVQIDFSSYTNGTYFLKMETKSGETYRDKVVKQ